jgi:hypothetical protein
MRTILRFLAVILGILLLLPGFCFIGYGVAGFLNGWWFLLIIGALIMLIAFFLIKAASKEPE